MLRLAAADGSVSDWLSDTSNDILRRIAAGAAEANQWMMLKAIDLINSGLRINLGASWLQDILGTMRYLVLPVVGVLFVLQVVAAMLAHSPRGLWRAVWGSALGLVLGSACAVLTAGLLLIVDQFSAYLLGDALTAAQDGMKKAFEMDGAIDGSGWLIVTIIAALGIVAWGVVIGVLFLRKAIIIGTVVFGPLAMAGLATGKTKTWATKWAEVVFALALSKFVICAILALAYSAVGASVTGDVTDALLGSIWVLLAALSPFAVLGFVHFAGDQITAANTSGVAGAVGNARQVGRFGKSGAAAVGGVVGGTAGFLAGRSHRTPSQPPRTPSTAVGGHGPTPTPPTSTEPTRSSAGAGTTHPAESAPTDHAGPQSTPPRGQAVSMTSPHAAPVASSTTGAGFRCAATGCGGAAGDGRLPGRDRGRVALGGGVRDRRRRAVGDPLVAGRPDAVARRDPRGARPAATERGPPHPGRATGPRGDGGGRVVTATTDRPTPGGPHGCRGGPAAA